MLKHSLLFAAICFADRIEFQGVLMICFLTSLGTFVP